ncbi:cytochrome P450 [Mycena albidolilacea]|uniref:Cytochrome P450 n=1 Tax=Mycena albidolilacea TaxID=1033008 RepID=A0AAD6ZSD2_9AGAR|nr:cytochrome P450 [Mycena albidolilacea]
MTPVHQLGLSDVLILLGGVWVVTKVVGRLTKRKSAQGARLNGPPNESIVFGMNRLVSQAPDSGIVYQEWAAKYGPVFEMPMAFGGRKLVLCDPKAVNHFYSMERSIYVRPKLGRAVIANLFGRGLLWAEGESHKRQRKALTPAFSNAVIRRLTEVFYDSAHKLKTNWDNIIDIAPPEGAIIDVEHWMNLVALDSIGIAGFSHDFRTLDGEYSAVAAAFDSLNFEGQGMLSNLVFLLGTQFPFLAHLPSKRNRIQKNLRYTISGIADELLERTRRERKKQVPDETSDRSIIGLLLKAEEDNAELHMDQSEVMAQMNVLLLAGYETTSISLTWALIELARKPEKQAKLRQELADFGADPTWDNLNSSLPYLDSVVLETLRLHPPVADTTRQAMVDDVLPVSEPITTASGEVVDSIFVAKDTIVTVSIRCMNQSEVFWGANAKEFEPERWHTLADDPLRAKEIQGHRHIITFIDGPRTCLGKSFALAEFKAVLSVLIRYFTFEFPDGPETEIATHRALIPRPKVAGQPGGNVPMRVGRAE